MKKKSKKVRIIEIIIALLAMLYGLVFISAIVGVFLITPSIGIFQNINKEEFSNKNVLKVMNVNLLLLLFFVIIFPIVGAVSGNNAFYYTAFGLGIFFVIPILFSIIYLKMDKKIEVS